MLFLVMCYLALLTSGVKTDEEGIENPKTDQPTIDDVTDVSPNTEEPNTEPQSKDLLNIENNGNLPTTSTTETLNNEQSTTTLPDIAKTDDSLQATTTEATSTLPSNSTSSNKENIISETSKQEIKDVERNINQIDKTTNTETPTMESPTESLKTEKKQDSQRLEPTSTLPSNSTSLNKETNISEATNQQIKDDKINLDQVNNATNTETTTNDTSTESPKTQNNEKLSSSEILNTTSSNTESSNTDSPNIEKEQDSQRSETTSGLPSNSSSSNNETIISEASNQQIKGVKRNIDQVIKDGNTEKSNKTETNARNKTKPIERPNIVFIVADDLGWDDVSFHGSDQIITPNIDTLAYQSVILHNYYTEIHGTASRSALFTGKYPLRLGTQGASIKAAEDRGIPITERLLPAYLKKSGYKTHLIGKWDVGKSRKHYLPTNRGFDTFYGFLGSSVDYLTYNTIETWDNITYYGLDFFDNESPVLNTKGYLTDSLTERAKKGLVTSLDLSIGQIVSALAERDILKNTLIVFVSDNGAPSEGLSQNFGSNLPLRGMKNTPWEGGARSIAFLWHPSLQPEIRHGLFHVTDWLPTIIAATGGNVESKIDGINQWEAINQRYSKRNDILITIDDQNRWAALREGDFKIIVGDVKKNNSRYFGTDIQALRRDPPVYEKMLLECETYYVLNGTLNITLDVNEAILKRNASVLMNYETNETALEPCVPTLSKGCLFNISRDPREINDLWYSLPEITKKMTLRLRALWAELEPKVKPQLDLRADPAKNNYIWLPWVPNNETMKQSNITAPIFPLQVTIGELEYLVNLNLDMFKEKMYDSIRYMGDSFMKTVGGLFNFSE